MTNFSFCYVCVLVEWWMYEKVELDDTKSISEESLFVLFFDRRGRHYMLSILRLPKKKKAEYLK